ncbi:MAG: helix-turn-helix domain-containing protein [Solirubrobacterales bacterium]|nr:helix-turn-helix domain-containing protein [Solirubrobacterales bacterium]
MLGDGRPVGETEAPPGAIRYAKTMVHRGTPLATLLRAYRLGTMWFWTLWKREIARRVEDRELAATDDATRRVRATVEVLLESGQRTAAARRLGIHQNTVHYRAKHAERMLGHPLSERRFEVEAALRLLKTIET